MALGWKREIEDYGFQFLLFLGGGGGGGGGKQDAIWSRWR